MVEEQYFNCKKNQGYDVYEFFSKKIDGVTKNFKIECNSGETNGKWSVLGPELTKPAVYPLHNAWRNRRLSQITVYKYRDPSLNPKPTDQLFVMASYRYCLNWDKNDCDHGNNPHKLCTAPGPSCKVEVYNADPKVGPLYYWYFKTILTTPELPGRYILLANCYSIWACIY